MIAGHARQVLIANTFELKSISFTNKKTDKVDAYKLARILKAQIMSGEEQVHEVVVPSQHIQDLRALFTAIDVIADIIAVHRFSKSKKSSNYLRSTPKVESSNEKTIIKSTNTSGRKVAITLLSQALNHYRDTSPNAGAWYERLRQYKRTAYSHVICR